MRRILMMAAVMMVPVVGWSVSGPSTIMNDSVAYSTNPAQNLQQYGSPQGAAAKLSAQVTWSSTTYATGSFTDGSQSTGALTVVSTQGIVGMSATNSITVPSTSAILGSPATNQISVTTTTGLAGLSASFTTLLSSVAAIVNSSATLVINGQQIFTQGGNWASSNTLSGLATTLAAAINADGRYTAAYAVVGVSTGVVIGCVSSGTFCNGYIVNSSTPAAMSSGTFSGGANPVAVSVNNGQQTLVFTYGGNWTASTTSTGAATNLASAMNGVGGMVAASTPNVVFASAVVVGTAANSWTIATSSASRVSVSSTSFLGGLAPALLNAYFTVNGTNYRNGYHWTDVSGTSTGTAASIAAFFNAESTGVAVTGGGLGNVRATATGGVVSLVTFTSSTLNNAITLATTPSSGGLTVGSALFTGGQSPASITINGTTLTIGTDWAVPTIASTTANEATAIAAAINANATLAPLITAFASGAVVTSTADATGTATNYTTVASTPALVFTNATMTGGTNTAYNITTDLITIANHGFTRALPVLLSTGGATIGPLVNQTTYYVVVIDSNTIGVSSTSAVALTGNYINLTSSSTGTSAHTLTLVASPFIQGQAGGKWQVSNDGINFNDYTVTSANVVVSSQTYFAVNPSTTTVQDFGFVDYGYLRYNITGPSAGAVNLKVILNAKD